MYKLIVTLLLLAGNSNARNLNLNKFADYVQYPSESTGELVSEWNEEMKINPEEMGEYFEGDIIYPGARNGLLDETLRWKEGIVPYVIAGPYDKEDLDKIFGAMEQYHKNTCIRFRKKKAEDVDYLSIQNTKTGCWSSVGKIGGKQDLNLQSPGCVSTLGTPIHEFMHALGFHHEQTREERDDFVTILWKNIAMGRENNFEKLKNGTSSDFQVPYDYDSVMHYSKYAFSKNQQATIDPKEKGAEIGQRKGFSEGDLKKVNSMYGCGNDNLRTTEKPDYNVPHGVNILDIITTIFG
nr:zinc metalloproteinase nas-15-like [Onthophagus taurus]